MPRNITAVPALLAAAAVSGFVLAAARAHRAAPGFEGRPFATLPPAPEQRPVPLKLPPPTPAEALDRLLGVFGDAVLPVSEPPVARDFNGDGAEDLAVVVRASEGRLAALNDRLANWTVQDACEEAGEASPAVVEAGETLLAVVHGHGAMGWRNREARQCYLVRHAAGPPFRAWPRAAAAPLQLPRAGGDLLLTTVGGRTGFVYWTSARYAWRPLPGAMIQR